MYGYLRRYVLRKLQSADLCDYMECRCVYQNNIGSDSDSNVDQLRDLAQQAVDVTAQIYAERSQQTKKEKDRTSEQSDSFCYKIPVQNHFPECTELYYDICRCIFCQSDPVIRLDVQSALSSL